MNRKIYEEKLDLKIINLQNLLQVLKNMLEKNKTSIIKISIEKVS